MSGRPVYRAHLVGVMTDTVSGAQLVALGVGPEGRAPAAYLALCPTDGVSHLVGDLIDAASLIGPAHCACPED